MDFISIENKVGSYIEDHPLDFVSYRYMMIIGD